MLKRYSTEELNNLWNDQAKFESFLEVEIEATLAFAEIGIVPKEDAKKIKENAKFILEDIYEIEKETRHDVIAFTRAISKSLGEERKWVHYGLTSTDVVDTAYGVQLKKVNKIISSKLNAFIDALKNNAVKYAQTPCIGRTHGIHADITSFGLKWSLWYDEAIRAQRQFNEAAKNVEFGKISGAVGNFANTPPEIQDIVCKNLGLGSANISTQTLQRDRHASYIFAISQISSLIEKIATEIRHLQRTEVNEVQEFFRKGQKGSSAMPHKRNPIASENMCGCARVIRGYVVTAMENNPLWHERDISHSSAERIILADATTLIDYMLTRYKGVVENLIVHKTNMIENINKTNGVIFSQRVLTTLIEKGMSRENAYDLVQPIAISTWENKLNFLEQLRNNNEIIKYLNDKELDSCFDLNYFLKNVDTINKRIGIK